MKRKPDKKTESQEERRRIIDALSQSLLKKRDEAVIYRNSSGVERRWREDQAAFEGEDQVAGGGRSMIAYATGEATLQGNSGPIRSKAVVNVIRGKCETAEGRFADILLPVDDRNWGFRVTPVPELVAALKDDRVVQQVGSSEGGQETLSPMIDDDTGQPVKAYDIAQVKVDKAEEAMKGMESEVDDQLTECQYNSECRKVIRTSSRLGTGVLKGPNVVKNTRKAWVPNSEGEKTVHVLEVVEKASPESRWVDIWNCYPDPQCGEDVRRTASYMWESDEILPRDLMSLKGLKGYFNDQIDLVLSEEPQRTQVSYKNKRHAIEKQALDRGHTYEKWEYHGDVDKYDLEALGCDCEDLDGKSLSACVVFVNDRPIKAQLNVLDTGDIPYDFFQWTKVSGSPWGIGIPRQSMWQQKIITAAWRAMMDNARDSAGANVVIGNGVEPADGVWELTGKKAWRTNSATEDVKKAFHQFQIQSNQQDLQNIIELSLKFLDMETSLPMMFQGEKAEMPETLGATNIIVDSNNVALRSRVKTWDDQITVPHITRYYHWNMQYNENPDIKGDYNVDARGTSVLLAKDQQAQAFTNILQFKGDPDVDSVTDWAKAIKQFYGALRLDIVKPEEDQRRDEEQRQQDQEPEDTALQVAQTRVDGEMAKAELKQESDMAEMEFKAAEAEKQRQHDMEIQRLEHQMRLMEFAQQQNLRLSDVKADLAKEASKQNLMRELADKKTAQVTSPPVEPPQKAPPGEAYQQ